MERHSQSNATSRQAPCTTALVKARFQRSSSFALVAALSLFFKTVAPRRNAPAPLLALCPSVGLSSLVHAMPSRMPYTAVLVDQAPNLSFSLNAYLALPVRSDPRLKMLSAQPTHAPVSPTRISARRSLAQSAVCKRTRSTSAHPARNPRS